MIQRWTMSQFGVGLAGKLDRYKDLILGLKPDLVQMPLHVYLPSEECCQEVIDNGTKLIGKVVLPKDALYIPIDYFDNILRRYKGLIQVWDFGGEPETNASQPGCRFAGDPEQFTRQMSAFYGMAKAIDPNNIVGGCGWITPTFNGYFGNDDRSEFFKECLYQHIAEYLDFISLNFYSYGYGGTKNIYAGMGKVNEVLATFGIERPIVVSEFGVPCAGDPTFLHIIQTPERQAISLVEQQIIFASMGIDYAIFWSLQYDGWGLVDNDGEFRPSWHAFRTMNKMLKGAEFKKQIKALPSRTVESRWLTDKISWMVFQRNSKEIHVVWISGGVELERDFPWADIGVVDMLGNSVDVSLGKVLISARPLYFITQPNQLNQDSFLQR